LLLIYELPAQYLRGLEAQIVVEKLLFRLLPESVNLLAGELQVCSGSGSGSGHTDSASK